MPLIDPGIVVSSPMLADTFWVVRQPQVVTEFGRTSNERVYERAYGIVVTAGARDVQRLPEELQTLRSIAVISRTPLHGSRPGFGPDLIVWAGGTYKVQAAYPHPRIGAGWFKVVATEESAQAEAIALATDPASAAELQAIQASAAQDAALVALGATNDVPHEIVWLDNLALIIEEE